MLEYHTSPVMIQGLRRIGILILLAVLLWIGLLINGAAEMRSAVSGSFSVTAGPFVLNTISKAPVDNGFAASFSFEGGWGGYLLCCLLVGIVWTGASELWRLRKDSINSNKTV